MAFELGIFGFRFHRYVQTPNHNGLIVSEYKVKLGRKKEHNVSSKRV